MEPERVIRWLSIHNESVLENASVLAGGTSSGDGENVNVTMESRNDEVYPCTPLSRLSLMDVFTRMDIGNTEFWGSVSATWLGFFIVYYVISSVMLLLMIMAYSYAYFIKRLHIFPWIKYLFITWVCFSCIHCSYISYDKCSKWPCKWQQCGIIKYWKSFRSNCFIKFHELCNSDNFVLKSSWS